VIESTAGLIDEMRDLDEGGEARQEHLFAIDKLNKEINAALAEQGYMNERGKAFSAMSVKNMLR
jgi:hypothetical protein